MSTYEDFDFDARPLVPRDFLGFVLSDAADRLTDEEMYARGFGREYERDREWDEYERRGY